LSEKVIELQNSHRPNAPKNYGVPKKRTQSFSQYFPVWCVFGAVVSLFATQRISAKEGEEGKKSFLDELAPTQSLKKWQTK
jgi:hypothetical protein